MKIYGNPYVDDFMLEKQVNQGIGVRMVEQYGIVFKLFLKNSYVLPSDLSTYTHQNFKRFLGENLLEKNWSSETYNSYRRYLRCFCEFLKNEGYLEENPFDRIVKRRCAIQLPKALMKNQVVELLNNLDSAFDKTLFTGKRNKTIVYTYLYTGLRLSELINLKIRHLQIHDGYLKVEKGKGNKDRLVPLSNTLVQILSRYLKERRKQGAMHDDEALFPTVYGNHLQKRELRMMIDRLRECLTFHFTWHQLRHTFATELVKNNFDIYNISRILGHTKIDTTKIYLSVDTGRLKKQLDKVPMFA